jgi:class 3 adenylate cyclase
LATDIFFLVLFSVVVIFAFFAGFTFGKKKKVTVENGDLHPTYLSLDNKNRYNESLGRGRHFIQKYEMVTVLLADIEGFSKITDDIDPEVLMDELNSFFLYFDSIIYRYQIEKIKTMGDAYMCAGGILYKNQTNPVDIILLALDVQKHQKKLSESRHNVWPMRIGIHTGPVIAGMLGQKKLAFDIWGHTVNVTARLETSCKPGRISISGTTYEKVKQYFDCEYHGIAPRTNEKSYLVNGLKADYAQKDIDGQQIPNHAFFIQMQFLRLIDLEEYVVNMMTNTASNMFFHNFNHIMDVYKYVEILAQAESIPEEDILLLKTAALLHDIGYSISYDNDINDVSENIAREFLPSFKYTQTQIEKICRLMRASHYESTPLDIAVAVMNDANNIYLGRDDYSKLIINLLHELEEHNIPVKNDALFEKQCNRLREHKFYTQSAKNMVTLTVEQQIVNLKFELWKMG